MLEYSLDLSRNFHKKDLDPGAPAPLDRRHFIPIHNMQMRPNVAPFSKLVTKRKRVFGKKHGRNAYTSISPCYFSPWNKIKRISIIAPLWINLELIYLRRENLKITSY